MINPGTTMDDAVGQAYKVQYSSPAAMNTRRRNRENRVSIFDLCERGFMTEAELERARDQELVARGGYDGTPLQHIAGLTHHALYAQQAALGALVEEAEEANHEGTRITCWSCHKPRRSEKLMVTSCGHHWCEVCIRDLFYHSIVTLTLPRCCLTHEITLHAALPLLNEGLAQKYHAEKHAIKARADHRVYCHNRQCDASISSNCTFRDRLAYCMRCGETTCLQCEKKGHKDNIFSRRFGCKGK